MKQTGYRAERRPTRSRPGLVNKRIESLEAAHAPRRIEVANPELDWRLIDAAKVSRARELAARIPGDGRDGRIAYGHFGWGDLTPEEIAEWRHLVALATIDNVDLRRKEYAD